MGALRQRGEMHIMMTPGLRQASRRVLLARVVESMAFENEPATMARLRSLLKKAITFRIGWLFVVTLALGVLLFTPLAAQAQPTRKVPRVGVLGGQSPEVSPPILALRQGLSELGYVEGQNIAIEWRWAQGKNERYPDLAAELVKLKVDIIVAASTAGLQAAQRATRTIPIVMGFVSWPDKSARGGRNGSPTPLRVK